MNNKYSTWHVWVEVDGVMFDVGTAINRKLHNINIHTTLTEIPLYKTCDLDTQEQLKTY